MSVAEPKNFYCSEKFTWLSVDLEKRQTFSCCAASPAQLDLEWVKQNPGRLFNTPLLQMERQQMLDNRPVSSCEEVCWKPERDNLVSRRQLLGSTELTHTQIDVSSPTKLNIVLGSTCNLTCSYCCKHYSSSWLRDIQDNGPYLDQDRFKLTNKDKLFLKVSQREHQESEGFRTVLQEIQTFSQVADTYISGGEPFLHNNLSDLLNTLDELSDKIVCYTGLGVDPKRFCNQLNKIKNKDKLTIVVSGETCGQLYEFNRYGNTWSNFMTNIDELQKQGFNYEFSLVISNLTIFGIADFVETFQGKHFQYQFCAVPDFLGVNVLDPSSKQILMEKLQHSNLPFKDEVCQTMSQSCSDQQKNDLSIYLKEFAKRRNLNLSVFPESFCSWIEC